MCEGTLGTLGTLCRRSHMRWKKQQPECTTLQAWSRVPRRDLSFRRPQTFQPPQAAGRVWRQVNFSSGRCTPGGVTGPLSGAIFLCCGPLGSRQISLCEVKACGPAPAVRRGRAYSPGRTPSRGNCTPRLGAAEP